MTQAVYVRKKQTNKQTPRNPWHFFTSGAYEKRNKKRRRKKTHRKKKEKVKEKGKKRRGRKEV